MIDIYDEVGYIRTVLEHGLSEKWRRDSALLIKFYKSEGYSKKDIKEKIKQKCKLSKNIAYNEFTMFDEINKLVDTTWKKDEPLRQIKEVVISKEVLDWFLNLSETFKISDEKLNDIKSRRAKVSIKNNPINWKRTKYLFTLYIWTKVQENYLDRPQVHYLNKYGKRFKEDANLPASFQMQNERNLLYDLGFININYALGIEATFIENNDVFKTPITDKNKIVIDGTDLYRCGYWLEKQKMGTFICQNCGEEFAHYSFSPQEQKRKYCKDCALKIRNNNMERYCIDCGIELKNSSLIIRRRKRCPVCQKKFNNENSRIAMQKARESKKVNK